MFGARFDTAEFERSCEAIAVYAEGVALEDAAEIALVDIRRKTASGVDADNETFHAYSPGHARQRQRFGFATSPKDLKMSGGLMNGLNIEKAPKERSIVPSADRERVAEGQMYHPKWRYHHNFLAVGDDTIARTEEVLAEGVQKL